MATVAPPQGRWLFGPAPDLLLGCGLLYVLIFLAYAAAGADLRTSEAPYLFPLLALLFSTPHYGATLLRVYEERASRRAYTLFAVHATGVVIAAFVIGLYNSFVADWILTLYFTWSPWHYTGQNYGLAVMFLRRRGVPVSPALKRWIYASFILSYALVFVMMHAATGTSGDLPLLNYRGSAIHFRSLGIPQSVVGVLAPAILVAGVLALLGSFAALRRRASLRDLVPTGMLVLTQALWFSLPFGAHFLKMGSGIEVLDWRLRDHFLNWIVFGHAIQYLWVTTYYARATQSWRGYAPYLGKIALAGMALWTLPVVLIATTGVGQVPYWLGLALLAAAAINIHHFILDGAIWKLRNSRIASVLIRSESKASDVATPDAPPWRRRLVWGVAGVGFALGIFCFWQEEMVVPNSIARRDFDAARAAMVRMSWLGRTNPVAMKALARAEREYDQKLALRESQLAEQPNLAGTLQLGQLYEAQGDLQAALRSYQSAIEAGSDDRPELLYRAGVVSLRMGRAGQAEQLLQRAVLLRPWHEPSQRELARAQQERATGSY
jgi:tetratricopeptide (TPR) repeat protein